MRSKLYVSLYGGKVGVSVDLTVRKNLESA